MCAVRGLKGARAAVGVVNRLPGRRWVWLPGTHAHKFKIQRPHVGVFTDSSTERVMYKCERSSGAISGQETDVTVAESSGLERQRRDKHSGAFSGEGCVNVEESYGDGISDEVDGDDVSTDGSSMDCKCV